MNVQSIIGNKGAKVGTIPTSASLSDVVAQLAEWKVGALVVSDDEAHIDGIISERDIVRALAADPGALAGSVADSMTTGVVTCVPADGVGHLMELMTERRIRHLPVVDEQQVLIGIVSIGDVVKARMSSLEQENTALSNYISGY